MSVTLFLCPNPRIKAHPFSIFQKLFHLSLALLGFMYESMKVPDKCQGFQLSPPNHNLVICVFLCYKQFTCFNYRFQLALCTFSLPLIDCYDYFSFNFTTLDRISPLGGRMYPDYKFVSITKPSEHLLSIQ